MTDIIEIISEQHIKTQRGIEGQLITPESYLRKIWESIKSGEQEYL